MLVSLRSALTTFAPSGASSEIVRAEFVAFMHKTIQCALPSDLHCAAAQLQHLYVTAISPSEQHEGCARDLVQVASSMSPVLSQFADAIGDSQRLDGFLMARTHYMRFAFAEVIACYEKCVSAADPTQSAKWVQTFNSVSFISTLKTSVSVLPIVAESIAASDAVAQKPQVVH
jgi:hypothetical protein